MFLLLLSAAGGALEAVQNPWCLNTRVQSLYRGLYSSWFHHLAPYFTMGFPGLGPMEGPRMAPGNSSDSGAISNSFKSVPLCMTSSSLDRRGGKWLNETRSLLNSIIQTSLSLANAPLSELWCRPLGAMLNSHFIPQHLKGVISSVVWKLITATPQKEL